MTSFAEGLKIARRKAVKINGKLDLNSLPVKYRKYIAQVRRNRRKRKALSPTVKLDKQVYLKKYYPWSYKDYIPTLVLQGWYEPELAKKKYYLVYGPHALDHVKFIRGDEAIARNFAIGKSLYINGQWRTVRNKVMRGRYQGSGSAQRRLYKNLGKHSSRRKEEIMHKRWDRYRYGQEYIPYTERKEGIKLSKIQEVNEGRKEYVYEIPPDAQNKTLSPKIQRYYEGQLRG